MRLRLATAVGVAVAGIGLIAQTGAPLPRGWTGFVDPASHCMIAVPPAWHIDDGSESSGAIAISPGGRATATFTWTSAVDFASRLKSLLQQSLVHENSTTRLWVEYARDTAGIHHVVAVPADGGHCTLYFDLNEDADDALRATARTIIATLGALR